MGNTTCCDADSDQSKDVQMKEIATSLVDSAAGLSPPLSTRDAKVTQKYVEAPTAKNNGQIQRWSVTLRKEEGTVLGLGFHIPKDNSTMSVKFIQEGGLAEAFNQKNPDLAFKPGDRVLVVNEATEAAKVKKQLKSSSTFNLTFERP